MSTTFHTASKRQSAEQETRALALFDQWSDWALTQASYSIMRGKTPAADAPALKNAALFGLWEACLTFDESRGLSFKTFAAPRIRGEIGDEGRRADFIPRLIRKRDQARRKCKHCQAEGCRKCLGKIYVGGPRFDSNPRAWTIPGKVELDAPSSCSDGHVAHSRDLICDKAPAVIAGMILREEYARVVSAIPTAHRECVLAYYGGKTMREIAVEQGLSESRISQIVESGLERCRRRLNVESLPHRRKASKRGI